LCIRNLPNLKYKALEVQRNIFKGLACDLNNLIIEIISAKKYSKSYKSSLNV